MIKFKKHLPNFCRDFDEEEKKLLEPQEYSCIQDILDSDWCRIWINNEFIKFSICRRMSEYQYQYQYKLMVEQKDKKFWVLGFLDQDIPELPTWIYPKEKND